MLNETFQILKQAIMISGFVFLMMLIIEYINVQTKGLWQKSITKNKWNQYFFAALLGAIPGCLGAFTAVAMFSHRLLSFGAIVTTMIATSGDEAFVMFAMFPEKAILLTIIIIIVGIIAGYLTDKIPYFKKIENIFIDKKLPFHEEKYCKCFQKENFFQYIKNPSRQRIIITIIILFLLTALLTGLIAGEAKLWIKISLLITILFSLFVVISVPEHFLIDHIWKHIIKKHILQIFLWTFGTMLAIHFLMYFIDIESWITGNMLILLIIAVLIGIIPESGPHLIFVTLFAQGTIPFSILIASSISQDGHGMLPLFAESKKSFIAVKAVNIIFAFIIGIAGYFLNF